MNALKHILSVVLAWPKATLALTLGGAFVARDLAVDVLRARLAPTLAAFDCTATFGGTYQANVSARRTLGVLSVALLVCVFLVLVVATRSAAQALVVMATVPLSLVGAVVAVALTGRIVSVASTVGLITVIGFVVRNGLLLVNRYAELARQGTGPVEAIRLGSRERMVPILMTSLTTVLGLIPLVTAYDLPGGEILAPLAAVQLGGLVFATLAALVVVPALAQAIVEAYGGTIRVASEPGRGSVFTVRLPVCVPSFSPSSS